MKIHIFFLTLLLITGCKKGEDTPAAPEKTVNDIVLTAKQLGVPLSTYDTGPYPIQSAQYG